MAHRDDTASDHFDGSSSDDGDIRGTAARLNKVRDQIWGKLRAVLPRVPFAHDLVAGYYCAMDRGTPLRVKAILASALAYFILPIDAVPDMIVGVGFTDDAAVLAVAMRTVASHVTDVHREAARRALDALGRGEAPHDPDTRNDAPTIDV